MGVRAGYGNVTLLCHGFAERHHYQTLGRRIRTTHVTGLVTDMGIELGKLFSWNASRHDPGKAFVRADRRKLKLLASLVALFFSGGVVGAIGFEQLGFAASLILAAMLLTLAIVPVLDDLKVRLMRAWQ